MTSPAEGPTGTYPVPRGQLPRSIYTTPAPPRSLYDSEIELEPVKIAAFLRSTPKGRLRYDRGGFDQEGHAPRTPENFVSVVGEVTRKKSDVVDQLAKDLNRIVFRNQDDEIDVSKLVVKAPTSPNRGLGGLLSPRLVTSPKSPTRRISQATTPIVKGGVSVLTFVTPPRIDTAWLTQSELEKVTMTHESPKLAMEAEKENAFAIPDEFYQSPIRSPITDTPASPVDLELERLELQRLSDLELKKLERRKMVREREEKIQRQLKHDLEQKMARMEAERLEQEKEMEREAALAEERRLEAQKSEREARERAERERLAQLEKARRDEEERRRKIEGLKSRCRALLEVIMAAEKEIGDLQEDLKTDEELRRVLLQSNKAKAELQAMKPYLEGKESFGQEILEHVQSLTSGLQGALSYPRMVKEQKSVNAAAEAERAKKEAEDKERLRKEEEEKQRRIQEEAKAKAQAQAQAAQEQAQAKAHKPVQPQQSSVATSLSGEVSPANKAKYEQYANLKTEWLKQLSALTESDEQKSFRFSCQKAVNTPVNSINANTASHLKDKVDKLMALIKGQVVEVTGKQVSAASHPLGVPYCKYLLAKKLVDQGYDVVSSKPDAAFGIALVIVSLWSAFPEDFGPLVMAMLHEQCPWLIPKHKKKAPNEDTESHFKALGYKFDGEKFEDQALYVKKMAGCARLYAAICVTSVPKDELKAGKTHPHGVGNIWVWLTSVMNLAPVNDVTATLLTVVLETSGHCLLENYGKVFLKLLGTLHSKYLPLIKKATLEGSGGPVDRLETFLAGVIKSGTIKKPVGHLTPGFL